MTTLLDGPAQTGTGTRVIGAPRLLRGLDQHETVDLATHLALHGPLPRPDRTQLTAACSQVALTGRGGAGFPFAAKLDALRPGPRPVVVVNGSESEPASWKDRTLMTRVPHLVLDGAVLTARALGAREVVVHGHDRLSVDRLRAAAAGRRDDGILVRVTASAGGFVAGEATALMQTLNKLPGIPPGPRVYPTTSGVGGRPTVVSNVETYAQLAVLMRMGVHRYAETGVHGAPGTTLLTVAGAVARPLVVEVPTGTPLSIVLGTAHAVPDLQAVVIGGYHGAWHQPIGAIQLSPQGVHDAGGSFGAGVVLAVDQHTCALGELHRVTQWLAAQSAGQCGPCRFGLPALAADVAAILRADAPSPGLNGPRLEGVGLEGVAAALRHARAVTGRGACAHPDGAARFVVSGLHALRDETERHLYDGGCGRPVLGELPL